MKASLLGFLVMVLLAAVACAAPAPTPTPVATATPVPTPPAPTPYPTATEAAAELPPTATPAATTILPTTTPIPHSGSIIGILPTATLVPTATPRPTATPLPTARPESTAADADICRRTPWVQKRILDLLNVKLCAAVSPRELFRFDQISFGDIRHPDDLAGFDNLDGFTYDGPLNHLDFAHTPALTHLTLSGMPEWPAGWSFADLPELVRLELTAKGAAACQLFDRPTLERLFAPLEGRLDDIALYFQVKIPPEITNDPNLAAEALADALGLDRDKLEDRKGAEQVGREAWDAMTAEERADRIASWGQADNRSIFRTLFSIEISEYYGCGTN